MNVFIGKMNIEWGRLLGYRALHVGIYGLYDIFYDVVIENLCTL